MADQAIDKLKTTIRKLIRRTRSHRLSDIVQELKTALTGVESLLWNSRSFEPSSRNRQAGATAVTMRCRDTCRTALP